MSRSTTPFQRLASVVLGGVILASLGSCAITMTEVCEKDLPVMERRFDDAVVALQPWGPTIWQEGRHLASSPEMARIDREAWQRWAMERLVETERDLDATSNETALKPVREALNRTAIDLVAFHGYAGSGRTDRMIETLGRILASSRKARVAGCAR